MNNNYFCCESQGDEAAKSIERANRLLQVAELLKEREVKYKEAVDWASKTVNDTKRLRGKTHGDLGHLYWLAMCLLGLNDACQMLKELLYSEGMRQLDTAIQDIRDNDDEYLDI